MGKILKYELNWYAKLEGDNFEVEGIPTPLELIRSASEIIRSKWGKVDVTRPEDPPELRERIRNSKVYGPVGLFQYHNLIASLSDFSRESQTKFYQEMVKKVGKNHELDEYLISMETMRKQWGLPLATINLAASGSLKNELEKRVHSVAIELGLPLL